MLFSLVVWPIVLYLFATRKRQSIPHFEVRLAPHQSTIGGAPQQAVELTFVNLTGSVTYLRGVRLRENRKHFPIPTAAVREISDGWRELSLRASTEPLYQHRESTLQTNQKVMASIAVAQQMDNNFYTYRSGWLRRCFRCPKYYQLEYSVMVGTITYSVPTIY